MPGFGCISLASFRRAIWDKHWRIDWVARSRRCELMAQIISGFTSAALHRPPPLLCNLDSPWRTQSSHSSKGKQVRKYCFASRSHTHEPTHAQAHWGRIANLQTYCRYLHIYTLKHTCPRAHTHTHTHTHTDIMEESERRTDKSASGKMNWIQWDVLGG